MLLVYVAIVGMEGGSERDMIPPKANRMFDFEIVSFLSLTFKPNKSRFI